MEVLPKPEWPGARRVGRYVLYDVIASGGMASVHLARLHGAVGFSRIVAVKCIHPHIAREPDFVAMFLDEARLASRIRHANVVSPLDVVVDGDELFLVLEYVAGQSLAELLECARSRGERVAPGVALRIVGDALQGLQAAHEARDENGQPLGLVHRDVSPHNLLVGVDGVSRVADFGVAKAFGRLQTTRSGQLKGKLGYMAPEQLQGRAVTPRSDVYSTAVTLWELLAGRRLIDADTEAELVLKSVAGPLPELRQVRPDLPADLCAIVERGLHRDPAVRYESALAFAEALEDVADLGSAREVSRWIQDVAAPALETRGHLVAAIERHVGLPPSRPPPPPRTTTAATGSGAAPEPSRPVREADGTPLGLARSSQAPGRATPSSRVRARSLLVVGAVAGVSAGVGWAVFGSMAFGTGQVDEGRAAASAAPEAPEHTPPGEPRRSATHPSPRAGESRTPALQGTTPAEPSPVSRELRPAEEPPAGKARPTQPDGPAQPKTPTEPATTRPTPRTPSVESPAAPPAPPPKDEEPSAVPDDLLGRH